MFVLKSVEFIVKYLLFCVKDGINIEVRIYVVFVNILVGFVELIFSCILEYLMEYVFFVFYLDLLYGVGFIMLFEVYYIFFVLKVF